MTNDEIEKISDKIRKAMPRWIVSVNYIGEDVAKKFLFTRPMVIVNVSRHTPRGTWWDLRDGFSEDLASDPCFDIAESVRIGVISALKRIRKQRKNSE